MSENPTYYGQKVLPHDWVQSAEAEAEPSVDEGLPEPVGFRMLVKPVEVEPVSKGGIVLVEESKTYADTACFVGQVIRQGPDCYRGDRFSGPWCQVGDYVAYGRHVGQKIEVRTEAGATRNYTLINDDDVRARVKDPTRIKMYL